MAKVRLKGHNYELDIRDQFRAHGWPDAVSSRMESKSRDDQGVDLCYTAPFNVQCKAVEKLGPVHPILARMPKDGNINVVFHKINHKGTVVSMTMEDFFLIIKNRQECQTAKPSLGESAQESTNSEAQK